MAAASLEGVWAKLARAEKHHDLLEQELGDFIEQDPQPIGLSIPYLDTESGWHVCLAIARQPPPPRLGVLLGDLLHNVRSALDHLVWQLVLLNGETPRAGGRGNDYPLAMSEHEWRTAEGSSLRGVAEEHRAKIQITQPYKALAKRLAKVGPVRVGSTKRSSVSLSSFARTHPRGAGSEGLCPSNRDQRPGSGCRHSTMPRGDGLTRPRRVRSLRRARVASG